MFWWEVREQTIRSIAASDISFTEPDVISVDASLPESVRGGLSAMSHNDGLSGEYDTQGKLVWFMGGIDPRGVDVAAGY